MNRQAIARVLVPLGAALCLIPLVTPPVALFAGLTVALLFGNPWAAQARTWTKKLLSWSIIGLGAGMNLLVVLRAGANGVVLTVLGIGLCLALGLWLARRFKVEQGVGLLITVGTAICGGSAIAAVVPVLKPKDHEVSIALGTVFILNAIALFLFPPLGRLAGLNDTQFGEWAALAIHDTSSVVGAAVSWSQQAAETATTMKLTRALWIIPLTFGIAQWKRRQTGSSEPAAKPARPWFILGFVLAAALVTFVPVLAPAGAVVAAIAKQALSVTLFLIGTNLTLSALKSAGWRPLAMGVTLWVLMASASLAVVRHTAPSPAGEGGGEGQPPSVQATSSSSLQPNDGARGLTFASP